jgi:hypothetical protein
MESSFRSLIPSCHYSAADNSEDPTQFNFSIVRLIFLQVGVPKFESSLHPQCRDAVVASPIYYSGVPSLYLDPENRLPSLSFAWFPSSRLKSENLETGHDLFLHIRYFATQCLEPSCR